MPMDIIKEWSELLPTKLLDKRSVMPRHKTLKWGQRKISDIIGICNHQTEGGDNELATANYHIKHFNSDKGAPGICYTFYIRKSGDIVMCNNIEDITWSQGYGPRPGSENSDFVSIVCGGSFSGPGYTGRDKPTEEQLLSLVHMWDWLCLHLNLNKTDITGHYSFGKAACPGFVIMETISKYKREVASLFTDKHWQECLVELGYDTGGIDGVWGPKSKSAISKFQKDNKLQVTTYRDDATLATIVRRTAVIVK
jgi:N-acetyl-anhydromuramyl-L-alanine amidase AmpD